MSLMNLIIHAERAYLVTDSAVYDSAAGGAVAWLGPKWLGLPDIGLAIASSGSARFRLELELQIVAWRGHTSQGEFLAALPALVRSADAAFNANRISVVCFAGYSHAQGRAFGGFLTTRSEQGFEAFSISWENVILSPGLPQEIIESVLQPTFDPYADSLPMIEQQRRCNFGSPEQPICGIGGNINVVAVSREGITVDTIHTYPAEVGEKVSLEPDQTLLFD
jgi:hypothetical protein